MQHICDGIFEYHPLVSLNQRYESRAWSTRGLICCPSSSKLDIIHIISADKIFHVIILKTWRGTDTSLVLSLDRVSRRNYKNKSTTRTIISVIKKTGVLTCVKLWGRREKTRIDGKYQTSHLPGCHLPSIHSWPLILHGSWCRHRKPALRLQLTVRGQFRHWRCPSCLRQWLNLSH